MVINVFVVVVVLLLLFLRGAGVFALFVCIFGWLGFWLLFCFLCVCFLFVLLLLLVFYL